MKSCLLLLYPPLMCVLASMEDMALCMCEHGVDTHSRHALSESSGATESKEERALISTRKHLSPTTQ